MKQTYHHLILDHRHELHRSSRAHLGQAAVAAAALTLAAFSTQVQIGITDVPGRNIALEKPTEEGHARLVFRGLYRHQGPTLIDRLEAASLNYWRGYRPARYETDLKTFPKIADIMNVGDADAGTPWAEKIIAARPMSSFSSPASTNISALRPRRSNRSAFRLSSSITTPRPWKNISLGR